MRTKFAVLALLGVFLFAGVAGAAEESPFHIGIMTGTLSQSEDSLRGAELMIQKYGDVNKGGRVVHITRSCGSPPTCRSPPSF